MCAFYRSILKILHSRLLCITMYCSQTGHLNSSPEKLYKLEHSLKVRCSRIAQPIPVAGKGRKIGSSTGYTYASVCVCVCECERERENDHQPTLDATMLHQNRERSIKTLTDVKRSLGIGAHPSQLACCVLGSKLGFAPAASISYHVFCFTSSQRNLFGFRSFVWLGNAMQCLRLLHLRIIHSQTVCTGV